MKTFDRKAQDVGNIVALEHVNVWIADQGLCTLFYVVGLGGTRDPYLMVSTENMWVNFGQEQFHLITNKPQVLRGHTGLVVPDLDALQARLRGRHAPSWRGPPSPSRWRTSTWRPPAPGAIASAATPRARSLATSPSAWPTSSSRCRRKRRRGSRASTSRSWVLPPTVLAESAGTAAHVRVGGRQELIFRETTDPLPALRRPSHRGLHRGLLWPPQEAAGARPHLGGEQRLSVPVRDHCRSRQREAALRDRARGP